jgi:hypothetical protein
MVLMVLSGQHRCTGVGVPSGAAATDVRKSAVRAGAAGLRGRSVTV